MTDAYLDGLLDELVTTEPREAWEDVLDRARRARRRYVAIVVAVITLLVVPSAWAIQQAWSGKHYSPTYAPRAAQIVDLSWLSPRHGWALLGRSCGGAHDRCALVAETRDGGKTWNPLGSLPAGIGTGSNGGSGGVGFCAPGRPCVAHIIFPTAQIGYAFGPSIFMTTDGGRSWQHLSFSAVESMASSGSRVFRIVYVHTGCPGPCNPVVQASTAGTDAWTRIPVAPEASNGIGESVYTGGRNVYLFSWGNIAGGISSHAGIEVSRDGGQSWSAVTDPCGSNAHEEWDAAAASATGNLLGVLCVPKSGGSTFVALSRDAGRTFARGMPVGIEGAEQIAISGSGTVAVGNAGVTGAGAFHYSLAVSANGGRTWRVAVRSKKRVAEDLASGVLQFIGPRHLLWVGYPYSLWYSLDAGRTWRRTGIKTSR
jgi:photosystem II stability/assembly factor-like uncharacterized protein